MKTKICSKCKIEKPFSEFNKGNDKNGLQYMCRCCCNNYRQAHKKEIAEYKLTNKEKIADYHKRNYQNNKEKILKQVKKYCQNNKKQIYKKRSMARQKSANFDTFASRLSWAEEISKGKNDELVVRCAYCGKKHAPTVTAIISRIRVLNGKCAGESRFYCSEACKQSCPSYKQIRYWKGQNEERLGTSREVSAWFRQYVLETDNWTCQWCGRSKEEYPELVLHVHHAMGVALYPMLQNDIAYAYTVCIGCHKKIHQKDGCTYFDLRRKECNFLV